MNAIDNTTIVFGSGRSGTTWVSEILSLSKNTILIDEPLKIQSSYKFQKLEFTGWGQYIPEKENSWSEATNYMERVLKGASFNPNHVRHSLYRIYNARHFIIKFIRAHFLMPWLVNNFQPNPPIYIIRNPYSVIKSQLNHPGWGLGKNTFFKDGIDIPAVRHFRDFYLNYQNYFKSVRYIEENLALRWCIENKFVISHPYHNKKWVAFHYEDLSKNIRNFTVLKKYCSSDFDIDVKKFEKPSYSSIHIQNKIKPELQNVQVKRIEKVLKGFNMDKYYKAEMDEPQTRVSSYF